MATYYALASVTGTGHAGTQVDPWSAAEVWTWMTTTCVADDECEMKDDASGFVLTGNITSARDGSNSGFIKLRGVSDWGTYAEFGSLPVIVGSSDYLLTVDNFWSFAYLDIQARLTYGLDALIYECDFSSSSSSIMLRGEAGSLVFNCRIRHTPSAATQAFYVTGQTVILACYYSGTVGSTSSYGQWVLSNTTTEMCVFDSALYGIYMSTTSDAPTRIFNNTFYDCTYPIDDGSVHCGPIVFANIVTDAAYAYYNVSTEWCYVGYNHFYNNSTDYRYPLQALGQYGDSTGDPKFVDPTNASWEDNDFSLDSGSPCLDNSIPFSVGLG